MYKVGIDLGSSYTKGVLVDNNGQIIEQYVVKTGFDFNIAAKKIINNFSQNYQIEYPIYTCGYGRDDLKFETVSNSEIIALAKAVYRLYNKKCSVIDIGGQDTKFIEINEIGQVDKFKMNRKCAAGTGSFIEELAFKMDVPTSDFSKIATDATNEVKLNSYCTVFAVSEIIGMIKKGITIPNIILGIYNSVISRSIELSAISENLVITGGIPDNHPLIVELFKKKFVNCESPANSQFLAAWGCVLLNLNKKTEN